MKPAKLASILVVIALTIIIQPGCHRKSNAFVIAIPDSIVTLDPMGGTNVDVGSERMRQLMFNSLIRKNEKFEYVGELATNIATSADALTVTFNLRDGVKFHDGKPLTAADAKYTLDSLLSSSAAKAASFFEGTGKSRQCYIAGVDAPDVHTLVVRLRKP